MLKLIRVKKIQRAKNPSLKVAFVFVNLQKKQTTTTRRRLCDELKSFAAAEAPCEAQVPRATATKKTKTKTMTEDEGKVCPRRWRGWGNGSGRQTIGRTKERQAMSE